jgi:hypothetical protein
MRSHFAQSSINVWKLAQRFLRRPAKKTTINVNLKRKTLFLIITPAKRPTYFQRYSRTLQQWRSLLLLTSPRIERLLQYSRTVTCIRIDIRNIMGASPEQRRRREEPQENGAQTGNRTDYLATAVFHVCLCCFARWAFHFHFRSLMFLLLGH